MSERDDDWRAVEALRKAAHEAPMNPVFQDHKGRRSLGEHSMAWASASRTWMAAKDAFEKKWGVTDA